MTEAIQTDVLDLISEVVAGHKSPCIAEAQRMLLVRRRTLELRSGHERCILYSDSFVRISSTI
jgi:hypothetical protein